jgi:hypothetical protein
MLFKDTLAKFPLVMIAWKKFIIVVLAQRCTNRRGKWKEEDVRRPVSAEA